MRRMAVKHGAKQLLGHGLLLVMLLPVLLRAEGPASRILDKVDDAADGSGTEWQLAHSLTDAELQSQAASAREVQVEATKKLWVEELAEKADSAAEAADLIEQIQSRTSGSALRRLRAACQSICPRCICGIILMPSGAPRHRPRKPAPKVTPLKPTSKPATVVAAKVTPTTPKPAAAAATAKSAPSPPPKESVKKTKKWQHLASLESELPDFLLDEGGDSDAFKREVGDHDPLSVASDESHIGIE